MLYIYSLLVIASHFVVNEHSVTVLRLHHSGNLTIWQTNQLTELAYPPKTVDDASGVVEMKQQGQVFEIMQCWDKQGREIAPNLIAAPPCSSFFPATISLIIELLFSLLTISSRILDQAAEMVQKLHPSPEFWEWIANCSSFHHLLHYSSYSLGQENELFCFARFCARQ